MKVLIIEDSVRKYEKTARYVNELLPDAEIVWVETAKVGVQTFEDCHIDYAIIDMQMPLNINGRIDREGGLYVLRYIRRGIALNNDMKYCINSSAKETKELLIDNGYEDVPFIHNSSMFNNTSDFKKFFDLDKKPSLGNGSGFNSLRLKDV